MSMFDPILAICSAICFFAPEPTATMAITAPTPIMIPNIVRVERILLTISALKAIRRLARRRVIRLPPPHPTGLPARSRFGEGRGRGMRG
jgi:hypothetical protein